ncbi:MAG: hypothetical protein GKS02_13390 [Alphaproteobacteria bacterium]|nr:hypothetical protein [Alphaproteobacteria bacterium]
MTHPWGNIFRIYALRLLILLCGCVASTSAIAADGGENRFNTLGGVWRVLDIKWVEIEKQWLFSASVSVEETSDRSVTISDLVYSSCDQLLQLKPDTPVETIHEEDIFRIDLNVMNGSSQLYWPFPVSIPVIAGECLSEEAHQRASIVYPGRLEGWFVVGGPRQKVDEVYRFPLMFRPKEGANVDVSKFDADLACNATLKDPTVQMMQEKGRQRFIQANIERGIKDVKVETDVVVIIALGMTKEDNFISETYKITDGKCVRQQ